MDKKKLKKAKDMMNGQLELRGQKFEAVANPIVVQPSKKRMVEEGRMDLANEPDPEFGKELAKAKRGIRKKDY